MADTVPRHIVVLDPTSPPRELRNALASRQANVQGRTVGFLWNSKPNGDILFGRLEELLRQKYEITGTIYRRKPTASIPASKQALDELAEKADVVVVGLADWGSCTSWSIHDAVDLERRGVPTVTVCSHLFERLGQVERRSLGMPDLPMAVCPHPIGGLKAEAVYDKAEQLLERVVQGLTSH